MVVVVVSKPKGMAMMWRDITLRFQGCNLVNPCQEVFGNRAQKQALLGLIVDVVRAWTYAAMEREEISFWRGASATFQEEQRHFNLGWNRYTGTRPIQITFGPIDNHQGQLIRFAIAPPTALAEIRDRDLGPLNDYFVGSLYLPAGLAGELRAQLVALPTFRAGIPFDTSLVLIIDPVAAEKAPAGA